MQQIHPFPPHLHLRSAVAVKEAEKMLTPNDHQPTVLHPPFSHLLPLEFLHHLPHRMRSRVQHEWRQRSQLVHTIEDQDAEI